MRKLAVLLYFVVIVSGMSVLLAGCGSPTPTEQVAPPANTAAVPQEPNASPTHAVGTAPAVVTAAPTVAAITAAYAATPSPAPTFTPVPTTDEGLEFQSEDPRASAGRDGGVTAEGRDPSKEGRPPAGQVEGRGYTWEDGDRTLTVYLQTDLAVAEGSEGLPRDVVAADYLEGRVVRGEGGQSQDDALPVFRSDYGELMTLPGGVLLVLDSEWSEAETDAFFSTNGIKMDRVSELSYAANGFFIQTEPGFPSLELANALAVQDGVEVSSPNWAREEVPK